MLTRDTLLNEWLAYIPQESFVYRSQAPRHYQSIIRGVGVMTVGCFPMAPTGGLLAANTPFTGRDHCAITAKLFCSCLFSPWRAPHDRRNQPSREIGGFKNASKGNALPAPSDEDYR